MKLWHQFVLTFMAFFAIMNPISNLPVYLSLTGGYDGPTAKAVARKALLLALGIVTVFTFAGQYIFEMFGISLSALRIGGGSLVFLIGLGMVRGKAVKLPTASKDGPQPTKEELAASRADAMSVAVSPLATPLLAGPGTIATAMSLTAHDSIPKILVTMGAFLILCIITYVLFLSGKKLVKLMGASALDVVTKLMGLILAVIGVQMMVEGLQGSFPILAETAKALEKVL